VTESKFIASGDLEDAIAIVVGTRPGIVMFAPIIKAFERSGLEHFVIHTGQHYSPNMDGQFFADLGLRDVDHRIEGVPERRTHGGQTAAMLEGVEKILLDRRPRLILVGGDANTNLAAALAARKLHINVGHVEAGERSYDWRMPEEHNRVIIDHISDVLFVTCERSVENLRKEGIRGRIEVTGNPIVDASMQHAEIAAEHSAILSDLGIKPGEYGVMTTHREENVDVEEHLIGSLEGVDTASREAGITTIFAAHPRTTKRLREFGRTEWVESLANIRMIDAVGYLDFLHLVSNARIVFTDSGGVQQEACIHHTPCVTLRENTEWTETLDIGANRLAGSDPERIVNATRDALQEKRAWVCPFGSGDTAEQIVAIAAEFGRVPCETTGTAS
jgi:UDP-N-acetylglucosamine 2-epimerase (non-hydrolysing)